MSSFGTSRSKIRQNMLLSIYNKFNILNCHKISTESGKRYLIHKGPNFGRSSETVVTDAHQMSNNGC